MLAKAYLCAVIGLEGVIVEVEVDTGEGLPSMVIAGSTNPMLYHFVGGNPVFKSYRYC